jgi:hypothetical protein
MDKFTICCLHQIVLDLLNLEQNNYDTSLHVEMRNKTKIIVEKRKEKMKRNNEDYIFIILTLNTIYITVCLCNDRVLPTAYADGNSSSVLLKLPTLLQ